MAPKRASKQQQQLNVDQFKLLKKPMDHLGKQINVPGSFWEGRCTVAADNPFELREHPGYRLRSPGQNSESVESEEDTS